MTRLQPVDLQGLTPAQQAVADRIASGARGRVRGPFLTLLNSPGLAAQVEQLGAYLRYESAIPARQRELAILTVARHWRAEHEWFAHAPLALAQGVPQAVLTAIGSGQAAAFTDPADATVHGFVEALLRVGDVPDALYQAAEALLGGPGVLDLTGLAGYYSMLALVLNTFQVTVADRSGIPWHV